MPENLVVRLQLAECFGVGEVAWSPDGRVIAFSRSEEGAGVNVYLMNVGGTNIRRLTDCLALPCEYDGNPTWSPDGREIAFIHDAETDAAKNPLDFWAESFAAYFGDNRGRLARLDPAWFAAVGGFVDAAGGLRPASPYPAPPSSATAKNPSFIPILKNTILKNNGGDHEHSPDSVRVSIRYS